MSNEKLLEYFIEQTNLKLDAHGKKLDEILKWKWAIAGGSAVISTACALLVAAIFNR